jgi:methyl-accepting chemotaxis protein
VDQTGETMNEVVQAVKRVTDIMAEIAAASNEQSSGIEQVNQAIIQMDEVTQQNAALVEEASASAEAMQEQAATLLQAVSMFKLATTAKQGTRRVAAKPAAVAHRAQPLPDAEKRLSGHAGVRKLIKTKQEKDGEWEEF